ncbi:MAG: hypothetical protein N3Z28_12555 [Synechococcaceae cyanobacterium MAG-AL2]|uniref:hypothetical protein n=1 Tax=Candidatus Regnicoccus frigidus TaxID=3074015 RepID=UPI002838991B|nr:hypothetical protein [Candidatus Regnicoccus frigidus]MCT4368481.1 hypothetical protein [Candidatus Regnicoccus frigidus MAG-AL2]
MTITAPWLHYLGLPWQWNADPDRDGGTDCFRLVLAVLALHDAPRPERIHRQWYVAAGRGYWDEVLDELELGTYRVKGGCNLDIAQLDGGAPIALGICVAGGLLTCSREEGVHWRPIDPANVLRWCRFYPTPSLQGQP